MKLLDPEVLRWIASVSTMGAGLVLAARVRPRFMGWAFVVLTLGSIIWVGIGYITEEYALLTQNAVITLINIFGIYRWLIWKGKI
jgi:hypothetical protein